AKLPQITTADIESFTVSLSKTLIKGDKFNYFCFHQTNLADCFDITPDCRSHLNLCTHSKYKQMMKDSCAKSCNLCTPVCKDRHKNCQQFVEDGFCQDELYSNEERKHLCGSSCNLC
ncbi:shTK domain protein, partial [Ostertagia ostertagi]